MDTKKGTNHHTKTITFRVQRFDPNRDAEPRLQEYTFPVSQGMTVLDCLIYIKEKLDGSLSFRASCRMGICGSCAMFVNGFPILTCHTQTFELNADVIEIRSLPNYPIIKDLIPDLTMLFEKHKSIKPYIIRTDIKEIESPTREYHQSPQELEDYLQFSYCLKCGICLSACPTVATDRAFIGPQALGQAFRYNNDTRDGGTAERLDAIDHPHGVWRCHMAGACADACPKGVDPAMAAQLLKRQAAAAVFGRGKKAKPAGVAPEPKNVSRRPNIPDAPPRTVE